MFGILALVLFEQTNWSVCLRSEFEEFKRHKLREGDIVFGRKGAVDRQIYWSALARTAGFKVRIAFAFCVESEPLKPRFLSVAFREEEHQRWMLNRMLWWGNDGIAQSGHPLPHSDRATTAA